MLKIHTGLAYRSVILVVVRDLPKLHISLFSEQMHSLILIHSIQCVCEVVIVQDPYAIVRVS